MMQSATLPPAMHELKSCLGDSVFRYQEKLSRQSEPYGLADYIAIVAISLLCLLTVMSTIYDLHYVFYLRKASVKANKVLRAWSIYWNTRQLLTITEAPGHGSLACIDGFRALSLLWVIMFHTSTRLFDLCINKPDIMYGAASRQKYLLAFTGHLAVDSFLVLSGLLLVYTSAYKARQLNLRRLPLFYWNRYLRLFPLLAVAVLIHSVMTRLFDGPMETHSVRNVERCRNYWWSTLLHVQNFVNPTAWCLGHTWYLSVDMQLYLVSPLVLHWVLRGRASWPVLTVGVVASQTLTCLVCFYFNFPDVRAQISEELPLVYWTWYYNNPVTRSPPFFIGMLLGYILYVNRNWKIQLSKWTIFMCYSVALVLSSSAILVEHPSLQGFWDNQFALNVRHATYRSCWAIALCWLIFACAHGYGGAIDWFLSLKLWRLVARISYAMYLFSYMVQRNTRGAGAGVEYYFDTHTLLTRFVVDLAYTLALSVAASILVETPFFTLYNLLLKRIGPQHKQ